MYHGTDTFFVYLFYISTVKKKIYTIKMKKSVSIAIAVVDTVNSKYTVRNVQTDFTRSSGFLESL